MIETKVEGSPGSVRAAATWVSDTLVPAVGAAGDTTALARRDASAEWQGTASSAYRDYAQKVLDAGEEQEDDLGKVAEKLRTYAVKLENIQERMSGRRSEARAGGLEVPATTIFEPPPAVRPDDLPAGSSPTAVDAWGVRNATFERANDKIELYNELSVEVEDDRRRLDEWVTANLESIAAVTDPSLSSYLVEQLEKLPATALLFSVDVRQGRLGELARHYKEQSRRLRSQAATATSQRRSGNPARRAAGHRVDPAGNRQTARALDLASEGAERVAKKLPIVGGVLTVASMGSDIAQGESPGQVVTSEGIAIGVGVAAGAVAFTLGAPVIAVAAVGTLAAVGAGMLAEYAWDHWVPEDVTEAIDEGLEDFGEGVKDVASDAWDAVTPW